MIVVIVPDQDDIRRGIASHHAPGCDLDQRAAPDDEAAVALPLDSVDHIRESTRPSGASLKYYMAAR